jgi:glycosyltransferase domain-containing protein
MRDDATIVVPTFNRALALNRLIRFLELLDCPFPVLVLDGSEPDVAAVNRGLEERYKFVTVRSYPPELHLGLRCADGLTHVRTKYVVTCGDDDFVVPSGISRGCQFLDQEARHVAVIGRVLALQYGITRAFTSRAVVVQDRLPLDLNLTYSSFAQRASALTVCNIIGCPPLYYSLARVDVLRDAYKSCKAEMKFTSLELLVSLSLVAEGYAQSLPILFGFRDYTSAPLRQAIREDPEYYFGLADLPAIQQTIAGKISAKDCLEPKLAEYISDLAVNHRLPKCPSSLLTPPKSEFSKIREKISNTLARVASLVAPDIVANRLNFEKEVMRALMVAQAEFVKCSKSTKA